MLRVLINYTPTRQHMSKPPDLAIGAMGQLLVGQCVVSCYAVLARLLDARMAHAACMYHTSTLLVAQKPIISVTGQLPVGPAGVPS